MKKRVTKKFIGSSIALSAMLACGAVVAQDDVGGGDVGGGGGDFDTGGKGSFLGGTFSMNGLVRLELAYKTTGMQNPVNNNTVPLNGVPIARQAGNPLTGYQTTLTPGVLNTLAASLGIGLPPGLNPRGVTSNVVGADVITKYVPAETQTMNYHIIRAEVTPTLSWGNEWSIISRIRAVYDPGELGYADFNSRDYDDINGGQDGGVQTLYRGKPNYFSNAVDGKNNPTLLEWSGRNYMVDFPALFVQYNSGNLTLRAGNQTIAWGQLLFFRVMDTANGLDLRRHLILDRALEEYADERQSALGIRATYQATDQIIVDAFVQQFRPSNLTNPNTPYNVIPSQFTVHDRYWQEEYYKKFNYGIRLKGEFGNYTAQAMFTRRYNQLGAINWTESGVNKALPNTNALGLVFNRYCELVLGSAAGDGCGPQIAQTPFEVAPAGVFAAEEWFSYAAYIRLHALDGLNAIIDDFPVAQQLLTAHVDNVNQANNELDAFFMAFEGVHGHIQRRYFAENIFGLGAGYVTTAEPGSIFDQIIFNVESTYTPERTFTPITLSQKYTKRDEFQFGLVAEKYQRFSTDFPSTYMVFQYLHQKRSDLIGLLLTGYGSEAFSDSDPKIVFRDAVPTSANPKIVPGIKGGANYVVLAALQPLPAYIWELSIATLVDVQGGVLVQPGVQWKPRGDITVNLFYNYINADVWGGNANKNLMGYIDFADEVALRLGYQF